MATPHAPNGIILSIVTTLSLWLSYIKWLLEWFLGVLPGNKATPRWCYGEGRIMKQHHDGAMVRVG